MYPFGNLPGNLIAFAGVLRREHGFGIGPGELRDAARVLEAVNLADERAVRHALRPVLSRTRDEAAVFDAAFTAFFFPRPRGVPQPGLEPVRRELEPPPIESKEKEDESIEARRARAAEAVAEERPESAGATLAPLAGAEDVAAPPARFAQATYSPLEAEAVGPGPLLTPAEPPWRDAARAFVRQLQLGLSRRWKPGARGRRFDLRRTLRASVQTGGEPLGARWLQRRRRAPRFVLLVDGSRSMDAYAATALQVGVALASATMRVEVYTFSTSLRRATDEVRRAAAGAACRLEHLRSAWGGGTSIGACLREFLQRSGGRRVSRDTIVIVASDGLDLGDPDTLREAMRELHRRSAGVVWLNPLVDTPGYEPIAAGMRAARPFVSAFLSVRDEAGFARLSRLVRLRS